MLKSKLASVASPIPGDMRNYFNSIKTVVDIIDQSLLIGLPAAQPASLRVDYVAADVDSAAEMAAALNATNTALNAVILSLRSINQ